MKKLICCLGLCMALASLNTFGQFGIHAGGVFSDMNVTGVGQDYDSNL